MKASTYLYTILHKTNLLIDKIKFSISNLPMQLNEHKLKYMDKEALELLDLLSVYESKAKPPETSTKSSITEQGFSVILSNVKVLVAIAGNSISQERNGIKIGLNEQNGLRLNRFIDNIYSDKQVNTVISWEFIKDKTWKWLEKSKRQKKMDQDFSNYIISEMELSIKEQKIFFQLIHINIVNPFKIGDVEFGYFTSEYFDNYIEECKKYSIEKANEYIDIKKMYKGSVYVAYTLTAERERAKQLAFTHCALSMDVLKICSNTLDQPTIKLSFDIDSRAVENPQSEILIQPTDVINGLVIDLKRSSTPYYLDEKQMQYISKRGLQRFNAFILNVKEQPTELEKLILQGIPRLAKALTNINLHHRIADLFTILESLLLLQEDAPIIDTVSKYASKLVCEDKATRKIVIKLLRDMYKVRSQWVHHAKEKEFEIRELVRLQRVVHKLLYVLIDKTNTHKEKQSLLEEIDEAILGAY